MCTVNAACANYAECSFAKAMLTIVYFFKKNYMFLSLPSCQTDPAVQNKGAELLDDQTVANIAKQVLEGLNYLHSNVTIHRLANIQKHP